MFGRNLIKVWVLEALPDMTEAQFKGKIFENLLRFYLKQQGFTVVPRKIQNYYGVSERANGLNVKGRGGWHQVDALGQFQFQVPFVYPIRLISEAKCHKRKIGLPIIRNFMGALKDISENYFVENYKSLKHSNKSRFTDCGAIFSTSEFSKNAQMYAYAQGVYLIQTSNFLPLIKKAVKRSKQAGMDNKTFLKDFCVSKTFPNERFFCYSGTASNLYPLIITSEDKFPSEEFRESDEVDIKIYYVYDQWSKEVNNFRIEFAGWKGKFQLPRYIWEYYMKLPDFKEAMLDMKGKILNFIDIPLKIANTRRIIRLKLDKSWLDAIREGRH